AERAAVCPSCRSPRFLEEPIQPIARERDALFVEAVEPGPGLPLVCDEASSLQNLQMTRRCRPSVLEEGGDLAGAHLSALEVQRHQNEAPRRMRQRREHLLICI